MRIGYWSSDVCSADLGKAYATSGGLHGVGVSVVNALSVETEIEVARGKQLYRQRFSRGVPLGDLEKLGPTPNRRGTSVAFVPDPEIFGEHGRFKPQRSEEHTSELQSLMRISYAVFCLK